MPELSRTGLSLRLKILIFSMILALVPLGVAGMFMVMITRDELKSSINDSIVATAKELGQYLDDAYRTWQIPLALQRNAMDQPDLAIEAKIALLQGSAQQLPDFLAVGLMVEGFPPAYLAKEKFAEFLEQQNIKLENLNWLYPQGNEDSDLRVGSPRTLGGRWVLPLSMALQEPINRASAQIVALVDLTPIQYLIKGHSFTRIGDIVLVDRAQTILFGNAAEPILEIPLLQTSTGSARIINTQHFVRDDGQLRLGAAVSGQLIPWTITVSLSEDDATLAIRQMQQHMAGWLLVGFIAAFLVAFWFARRISQPVLEVARVVQRIGAGDLAARVQTLNTGDEISLLGACINDMAKGLLALHAAGAGTFHYDIEHEHHDWDACSLEIFGLTPKTFDGFFADWWRCIHPDDLVRAKQNISISIALGRPFDEEYRITLDDGEIRYIRSQGFTVQDRHGHSRQVSGLHSDVTAQKEAEKELIRAREAAEAANRAKSTFLANMSHELRTPLNAVLGYAQILEQDSSLSEKHRHSVEIMHRSGEYLLTLINDVLDLAKIEAGRFELFPAPCFLKAFFATLVDMFSLRARQKDIHFAHEASIDMPEMVQCDEKRLRQVVTNLLGNAMKFTEHGSIILRTDYRNGQLFIAVQDSGIGIAEDAINDIFEPFRQTGSSNYKSQGTGLGLSITLKLVKLMGGDVKVNSVLGVGSTFEIQVPAPKLDAAKLKRPTKQEKIIGYQRSDKLTKPLSILIADDVAENRDILVQLLQPLGFVIHTAIDGHEAFEKAQALVPDLLLVDLIMPNMNGLDVVRALRQLPQGQHMKMAALSASVFAEDHTHSIEAGCDAHLPKPFRAEDFFDVLRNLLPLEWNYSAPSAKPHAAPHDNASQRLSAEIVQHLLELGQRGDIKGIRKQLDELQAQDCCPSIVEQLQGLAKRFKLSEIRKLLETY